jgi:hypothetical protein
MRFREARQSGRGRRRFNSPAKARHVRPARQIDNERIVAPGGGIVARECGAQARRLNAHDGIDLRVEIAAATERFDGDGVRLDPVGLARKRRLDDEDDETPQAERIAKNIASGDAIELRADFIDTRRFRFRAFFVRWCQRCRVQTPCAHGRGRESIPGLRKAAIQSGVAILKFIYRRYGEGIAVSGRPVACRACGSIKQTRSVFFALHNECGEYSGFNAAAGPTDPSGAGKPQDSQS